MHFMEEDVMRLLSRLPHMVLAKQRSTRIYVAALVRDGDELQPILSQYPAVLYEPLDQHYALLRCLGSLSEEFISDLCRHYTWRGVVAAALLVALAPDVRYRSYLAAAYDRVPHNQWLLDLALAEIEHAAWQADTGLQTSVQHLRAQLAGLHQPAGGLRRAPGSMPPQDMAAARSRIKAAYQTGGCAAAQVEIAKHLVPGSSRMAND